MDDNFTIHKKRTIELCRLIKKSKLDIEWVCDTRADLISREVLKEMKDAAVSVSVAFNDNQTRGLFEANTVDTAKRIEALHQLKEAGVRTGALVCPVIPYITDAVQLVNMLEPYTDEIWIYGLCIDDPLGQNWLNIQQIINNHFPDLFEQIEPAIFSKGHKYWAQLRENLEVLRKDRHLNLNVQL